MSTTHYKIRSDLYLNLMMVDRPAPTTKTVTKTVPLADAEGALITIVIDVSGSMYYALGQVKEDAKAKVRAARPGDRFTIAWFSSPGGDNGILVQGAGAATDKDKEAICRMIDGLHVRSLTCFAEVLEKLGQTFEDLAAYDLPHALLFLTDGYPTDGYPVSRILAAIQKAKARVDSALMVGYGTYYGQALMTQMAEAFGGQVIRAQDIGEFSQHWTTQIEEVREFASKVTVEVPFGEESLGGLYSVRGKAITMLSQASDRKAEVPVPRRGHGLVYGFSKSPYGNAVDSVDPGDASDPTVKGLYAGALILTQKLKTDLAVEVMGALGDKAMVDGIANAFTAADYGRVENRLARAVERKDARFKAGCKPGCVPNKDAYSSVDALEMLMNDAHARIHVYHPDFKYTKIGVPSKPKPGYPEFEADSDPSSSLDAFTPHSELLNLSVLLRIPGHIKLDADHAKYGFQETYPTYIWRNYALIKDGNMNCQRVPLEMSQDSFEVLAKHGMVTGAWSPGVPFAVDFSEVPVMNRAMADGVTSAKAVCDLANRELELQGQQKVLNHYLKMAAPDGVAEKTPLTEEQKEYLKKHGIGYNGFSPPTETAEATDYYEARAFDIKIKSFSSLPTVDAVLKKMDFLVLGKDDKGKPARPLTPSEALLEPTIVETTGALTKAGGNLQSARFLHGLQGQIEDNKRELRLVRNQMQRIKMAVILAGRWFDEFQTRDNPKIDYQGREFTFALKSVKIDF